MRVRVIVPEFKLTGSIKRGEVLIVRAETEGKVMIYRVVTGRHMGKTIEPFRTHDITHEDNLPAAEWKERADGYLKLLGSQDAEIGRLKELVSGLTEALNKEKDHNHQLGKALEIICDYKPKEPIKNG